MAKIKVPVELETAVDKVLDMGITQTQAKDLFRYVLLTRAVERAGGNQADAGRKLGMSGAAMYGAAEALKTRLNFIG